MEVQGNVGEFRNSSVVGLQMSEEEKNRNQTIIRYIDRMKKEMNLSEVYYVKTGYVDFSSLANCEKFYSDNVNLYKSNSEHFALGIDAEVRLDKICDTVINDRFTNDYANYFIKL